MAKKQTKRLQKQGNPFRFEFIEERPEIIDRVQDRGRVSDALETPGSRLLIYGRRRMGKTTLCKAMAEEYRASGGHVVTVDFSTATQLADLSNVLLGRITESLGQHWQDYLGELMRNLRVQLETEVDPQTGSIKVRLQPAARTAPPEQQRSVLLGILSGANALAKQKGLHLAIIVDEFQELVRFEGDVTLWNLRGEMQHHAHLSYILTGSRRHVIDLLLASDRAFYKMFSTLDFQPVPRGEMQTWLRAKFGAAGVSRFEGLDALLDMAETCTVDRLRLAALAYPAAVGSGELTGPMIERAFRQAVAEDKAFFHSDWQQLTAHQQNVLRALAENEVKLTSNPVRERYSLPASGSVTNSVKALVERGLLYTIEPAPGCAFDNPFFKAWLRDRNREELGI